jgi:hypothetical protein
MCFKCCYSCLLRRREDLWEIDNSHGSSRSYDKPGSVKMGAFDVPRYSTMKMNPQQVHYNPTLEIKCASAGWAGGQKRLSALVTNDHVKKESKRGGESAKNYI